MGFFSINPKFIVLVKEKIEQEYDEEEYIDYEDGQERTRRRRVEVDVSKTLIQMEGSKDLIQVEESYKDFMERLEGKSQSRFKFIERN